MDDAKADLAECTVVHERAVDTESTGKTERADCNERTAHDEQESTVRHKRAKKEPRL